MKESGDDADETRRGSSHPDPPAESDADATQRQDASTGDLADAADTAHHPASASGERAPLSVGSIEKSQSLSRASVPPSEPRSPSRGSFSQLDLGAADRPARLQMIVALLLGLVLVAIPLYLWRRPRADAVAVSGANDAGVEPTAPPPAPTTNDDKPTVGDLHILLCQDPGPKKTSPSDCDHVVEVEKALTKAIEDSASCVTKDVGGGTVIYVADVSFKRRAINVATPKEGRTMKNTKAVGVCQAAVKSHLGSLSLDPLTHAHARYKISVTATYAGAVK